MFSIFGDIEIKGQSRSDCWGMVRDLRALGLLDKDAYPTVLDFIESLPHLYRRCHILTVTDACVFQSLVEGWSKEGTFDIYKSMKIFDRIISKIQYFDTRANNSLLQGRGSSHCRTALVSRNLGDAFFCLYPRMLDSSSSSIVPMTDSSVATYMTQNMFVCV